MPLKRKTAAKSAKRAAAEGAVESSASLAFDKLVRAFADDEQVRAPEASRRKFGSNGLRVNGKIFAMLVRGALVLKLPEERVQALVAGGLGSQFDAGKGKPMKEWLVLSASESRWLALAREARTFVARG